MRTWTAKLRNVDDAKSSQSMYNQSSASRGVAKEEKGAF